jgi:preprotein translocase subunit SecB
MDENNQFESGFKITNLILMESAFQREIIVTFDNTKTDNNVNVDVGIQIVDNTKIIVTETVNYIQKYDDKIEVSAKIKMVGVFEKKGETQIDLQNFGNVNGAAMIFPYIREHLTNLSAKAGIGIILLPPFNFTNNPN